MLGIAVYHINEVMTCRRNLSSKKVHYCRYSVPPLTFGCTFLGYRTPTITVDWEYASKSQGAIPTGQFLLVIGTISTFITI